MTKTEFLAKLKQMNACEEAQEWCAEVPGKVGNIWQTCQRGDWMLWLAGRAGVDRKRIVLAACECARLALKHVPAGEDRPLKAIEAAESWARGDAGVTLDDVRKAARAAYAADAAYAAAAARAAYAAAYAAAAARETTLAQCADVVRKHIEFSEVAAGLIAKATGGES